MTKLIRLQVTKIKYTGDSVGDDIRIEVECLDKFVGLNKRLKRGSDVALNAEIGQFFADGASFTLPVNIKIIERDLVFNDVGAVQENLKVNLSDGSPQFNAYKIEVRERRGFLSREQAVFEITVEAAVSDATLYVTDESGEGWIVAVPESGAEDVNPLNEEFEVYTRRSSLHAVVEALDAAGCRIEESELIYVPVAEISLADESQYEKIRGLIDQLEELDDVQNVYSNAQEN